MSQFNPYLNFPGNTEEAFNFYRSVLGGEFAAVMRFSDMEGCGDMAEADKNKIAHIALPVGEGNMLMGTDSIESMGQKINFGNNFYVCIGPDSREEADSLFGSLSDGGKVEMPLTDMPWGGYFGSFTDKFGTQWMLHYDAKAGSKN
jgi:PhnB protein